MTVVATIPHAEIDRVFPAGTALSVHLHDSQSVYGGVPGGTAVATAVASDPDFTGTDFQAGVDDWDVVEVTGTGAALATEATITRSGDGSAKVTAGTGDDSVGIVGPASDAAEQISVVEGETVDVTAYVYAAAGTPDASVTINWLDDQAAGVATEAGTPVALVAETWVAVTVSGAAPADTAAATVTVAIDSPDTEAVFYVDDVTVGIAGEPSATVFSGLTASTDYVICGEVDGVWRHLGFHAPAA